MLYKNELISTTTYKLNSCITNAKIIKKLSNSISIIQLDISNNIEDYKFGDNNIVVKSLYLNNDNNNDFNKAILEITLNIDISKFVYNSNLINNILQYYNITTDYTLNKLYNIAIDLDLNNIFYNPIFFFDRIHRIAFNKLFNLNIIRSSLTNDSLLYINDIKFLNVFKLKKNSEEIYIYPKLIGLKEELFNIDKGFELDISCNIQNDVTLDVGEMNNLNYDILFDNSITSYSFNIFDIFNYNFIFPRNIFMIENNIKKYTFPYASDVYSRYYGRDLMDIFKGRIEYKINSSLEDYININFNNIFLSLISTKYPDYTIENIKIFILFNNISERIIDNKKYYIGNISDRYNLLFDYTNFLDYSSNNHIQIDNWFEINQNNYLVLYNHSNTINLYDSNTLLKEQIIYNNNKFNFNKNTKISIEFNDLFNSDEIIEFNKIQIINNICLFSPFGYGNNKDIYVYNRILDKFSESFVPFIIFDNIKKENRDKVRIMYSISNKIPLEDNAIISCNISNINKNITNIFINSNDQDIIESINNFIDNIFIDKVSEVPLLPYYYYTSYISPNKIINIELRSKNRINDKVIEYINRIHGFKLKIYFTIDNNEYETIIEDYEYDYDDIKIYLKYIFNTVNFLINNGINKIEYFKINKMEILI